MSRLSKVLFCLMLLTFNASSYGQRNYYFDKKETHYHNDIINDPRLNSRFCQVRNDVQILKLTPYQLEGYGFAKKNQAYYSFVINRNDSIKKAFLLLLSDGSVPLYFYRYKNDKAFYIVKDSSRLIEVPKNSRDIKALRNFLTSISLDCKNISSEPKLVRYNKKLMTEFFDKYNGCNTGTFHFFKFGVSAGYNASKYYIPEDLLLFYLDYLSKSNGGGFTIELFCDAPIGNSNISIHPAIDFTQNQYGLDQIYTGTLYRWRGTISALKIPVSFRYYFDNLKTRPFISAGGIIGSNLVENFTLRIAENNPIDDNNSEEALRSDWKKTNIGWTAGAGVELKVDYRKRLNIEIRYSNLMRRVYAGSVIKNPEVSLISGFSF
jgi:hypothetical protein